jgi:hypothetical protein
MSLEVKQVIQVARTQFKELLPALAIFPRPPALIGFVEVPPELQGSWLESSIRLEELEKEGDNWAVTLSVPNPDYNSSALLEGISNARTLARIAKVIVINGEDGKLLALRERAA